MRRFGLLFCGAAGAVLTLVAAYSGYTLAADREDASEQVRHEGAQTANQLAADLDQALTEMAEAVDAAVEASNSGRAPKRVLAELLDSRAGLTEVGFARPTGQGYRLTLLREEGETRGEIELTEDSDESLLISDTLDQGDGWREPIVREDGDLTPVFLRSAGERGVFWAAGSWRAVQEFVSEYDTGAEGWALVLSRGGYALAHPSTAVVLRHQTVWELLESTGSTFSREVIEDALAGGSGVHEDVNTVTGQSSWFFYEPVPAAGWSAVVVRIKDDLFPIDSAFRRRMIRIISCGTIGLIFLALASTFGLGGGAPSHGALWRLAIGSALLMWLGMGVFRQVIYEERDANGASSVRIVGAEPLQGFLAEQREENLRLKAPELAPIPTGVFVQTLAFTTPSEAQATGYVWQKILAGSPISEPPGVIFPDSPSASITEAYRKEQDGVLTVGWRFEATVRQQRELSRYPYDHDGLRLRMWPYDIEGRVLLVPDLAAYPSPNPMALPGLADGLDLPGWAISGSYFDYLESELKTDLGLASRRAGRTLPQLRFNVSIKRNLLDSFIRNGVPLLIVLAMLFAVVATATQDEDESKALGFNAAGVMRIASALFFVILLAHINLRESIQARELVFMEYFYFVAYFMLLAVSLHAFLFHLKSFQVSWIERENGLIPKLLYWPVATGLIFVVTMVFFY